MRPGKIISGGQTGVDRAALDFAIERGIPWGGWAPKGWRAENGTIPPSYRERMAECRGGYVERTHRNVLHSTATIIVIAGFQMMTGGTRMTMDYASKIGIDRQRVYQFRIVADVDSRAVGPGAVDTLRKWSALPDVDLSCLNIAGPRESKAPGIYAATLALLRGQAVECDADGREEGARARRSVARQWDKVAQGAVLAGAAEGGGA